MSKHRVYLALFALLTAACATGSASEDPASGDPQASLPDSPCAPDEDYFLRHIWTPIVSTSCTSCHNPDGAAKNSRMVLQMPSEPDFLTANFNIMRELAAISHDDTSILLLRPSGRHPQGHTGGVLLEVTSKQYQAMAGFVGRVMGDADACADELASCDVGTPGQQTLRRLTRSEFDNTIRDLMGFSSQWGAAFAADVVVNGFDNNAATLTVTPLLADQVRQAAEAIAAQAAADLPGLLPCDASAGRPCAQTFITSFGERAFRRPVSEVERDRYLQVFDLGAEEGFATGIELVITAMLQSPNFLYRSEIGTSVGDGVYELTPYEIASELSYLLWGSMPDDELFAAARSGALADAAEIEAQARRMLASPKSRDTVARFTEQWLGIEQVTVVPKDGMLYPEITAEVRADMAEEANRVVADIIANGGSFADLMRTPYTIINQSLAALYGLPAPSSPDATGFGRVDLSGGTRGGLLTLGAVLTTHARPNGSSPTHRGLFVRERLLCQHLPPPPPGIVADPPALDPNATTRERYEQHTTDPSCRGCHELMDPIGIGFEHFDGIGRYRADENGLDIDTSGEILNIDTTELAFAGVGALTDLLANSVDARACFALQWVRFAYGVEEDAQLSCLIEELQTTVAADDMAISELIVALTKTSHFTRRLGDATDAPAEPPQDDNNGGDGDNGGDNGDNGGGDSGDNGGSPGDGDNGDNSGDTSDVVDILVETDSQWETGSCHSVTVTNVGQSDVDWQITIPVAGTINNHWNAEMAQMGAQATFSGVSWNRSISPGGSASFGFCVVF